MKKELLSVWTVADLQKMRAQLMYKFCLYGCQDEIVQLQMMVVVDTKKEWLLIVGDQRMVLNAVAFY